MPKKKERIKQKKTTAHRWKRRKMPKGTNKRMHNEIINQSKTLDVDLQ